MEARLKDTSLPPALRLEYETARIEAGTYNAGKLKEVFNKFKIESPNAGNTLSGWKQSDREEEF